MADDYGVVDFALNTAMLNGFDLTPEVITACSQVLSIMPMLGRGQHVVFQSAQEMRPNPNIHVTSRKSSGSNLLYGKPGFQI